MYAEQEDLETGARNAHDVELAISLISEANLARLATAARILIRNFGLDSVAADADDLVAEAMFRTASGRRQWKKGVDFTHHLLAVMKSIVDSWRKSAQRRAAAGAAEVRESDLPETNADSEQEGDVPGGPQPTASSPERFAESTLIARREVKAYFAHFEHDEAATAVLDGWFWEMSGPEIQEHKGLTKRQYEAAVLRIRRYADRQGGGDGH